MSKDQLDIKVITAFVLTTNLSFVLEHFNVSQINFIKVYSCIQSCIMFQKYKFMVHGSFYRNEYYQTTKAVFSLSPLLLFSSSVAHITFGVCFEAVARRQKSNSISNCNIILIHSIPLFHNLENTFKFFFTLQYYIV